MSESAESPSKFRKNLRLAVWATVIGLTLLFGFKLLTKTDPLLGVSARAMQGNAEDQFLLGFCYFHGQGVPRDYFEAVKWFRKAANQGFAQAQGYLAICYARGHGVHQDYSEALKWYRKAAEQGDASSQFNLGACYYQGQGVPKDFAEAYTWFCLSASAGDRRAAEPRDVAATLLSPQILEQAQTRVKKLSEEIQARTRKP